MCLEKKFEAKPGWFVILKPLEASGTIHWVLRYDYFLIGAVQDVLTGAARPERNGSRSRSHGALERRGRMR